jgi:hypothetical protein
VGSVSHEIFDWTTSFESGTMNETSPSASAAQNTAFIIFRSCLRDREVLGYLSLPHFNTGDIESAVLLNIPCKLLH